MRRLDPATTSVADYLALQESKDLLRFITCGSVDDGKSTLIGRLLYESKLIFEDHLQALESDSRRIGTQGGALDFALLVDGLAAEREQGITIDVAYRAFTTERRKFIVADTPGHEQYTRNMATGASTAELAVILVDARKGVLTQTRRHSFIVSLIGIKTVVLAVNKMDLVGYEEAVFRRIEAEYRQFAESLGIAAVTAIPLSALRGDNVVTRSTLMPWYGGPTLLGFLEEVPVDRSGSDGSFRMPVQWVNRPDQSFRGFSGMIAAGSVQPGDRVKMMPGGRETTIARIVTFDGDLDRAGAGQSVTMTFADEVDASRGTVITAARDPLAVADQFETSILWLGDEPMLPGRPYLVKCATRTVQGAVAQPKYKINVNTLEHMAARTLELNEIGVCNLALDAEIAFAPYAENRDLGGFILIDRFTNNTVGMGLINFALRRASNIHWQALDVNKRARAALLRQKPLHAVVHRPVRRRQVDHRQPGGEAPPCDGPSHLSARRRQCPPRAQQGSGLHRCRPGGEHPARRRARAAHGRCRADRAGVVHLAFPLRALDGARAGRDGRIHRGVRRHAAGARRDPRSQGPLCQGAARRDCKFHRHLLAL